MLLAKEHHDVNAINGVAFADSASNEAIVYIWLRLWIVGASMVINLLVIGRMLLWMWLVMGMRLVVRVRMRLVVRVWPVVRMRMRLVVRVWLVVVVRMWLWLGILGLSHGHVLVLFHFLGILHCHGIRLFLLFWVVVELEPVWKMGKLSGNFLWCGLGLLRLLRLWLSMPR